MRGYNTNTPGFPPSFFILPSLAWVYIFVSAGQVLLSAVSRCSASPSVSERVFLMYPWRCTPRPPTPMPSCSLEITTTLLISYAPIQNKNLKKNYTVIKDLQSGHKLPLLAPFGIVFSLAPKMFCTIFICSTVLPLEPPTHAHTNLKCPFFLLCPA